MTEQRVIPLDKLRYGWDRVEPIGEQLAAVRDGGRWWLLDRISGATLTSTGFTRREVVDEGRARIERGDYR